MSACLVQLALCLIGPALAGRLSADEPLPPRQHDFARWEPAIAEFEALDREQPPTPGGVLFVGSSTIRLWKTAAHFPDLPIVNRGFGGSEMVDSAHFAGRIILPHRPRVVLVYAGSNDLSKNVAPCQIHADFLWLAAAIHAVLPETDVAFLSVKPSVKRWPIVHRVRALNALVESSCLEHDRLHFLNVYSAFLTADGQPNTDYLAADGLHLNEAGYRLLTALVRPELDKLLQAQPAGCAAAAAD